MTPYYERDGITIYCGDCRDVLPTLEAIDVLLTDPPYGVEGGRGGQARERGKARYKAGEWEDTRGYIATVVIPVITSILAKVKRAAITPGVRSLFLYPEPADMGAFYTPAAIGVGPWGFQTIHPILFYGRDYRAGLGALPTGRILTEAAEDNGHPCAKPLRAWRWLLEKISEPGDLILDPFMGSGTTARACKDLGRRFVGIEIEERYCEIAIKRLAQEVLC